MKCLNDSTQQPVINQREMPFFQALDAPQWVPDGVVDSWPSYRAAVVWCWQNRPSRGKNEPDDQAMFARNFGVHAPHMSRFVNAVTKAPMDLRPDLIPAFESYTGWRGITQYLSKASQVTIMEQVIDSRRAA